MSNTKLRGDYTTRGQFDQTKVDDFVLLLVF